MKILPDGYTQLEYIEGTGTQYINTGFKPNQDTRVVADLKFQIGSSNPVAFGAIVTSPSTIVFALQAVAAGYRNDYGPYVQVVKSGNIADRFIVDKNKNIQTLNGVAHDAGYTTFSVNYPIYLFARNYAGTADRFAPMTLYSCQIYDNGTLVRNFVPCKNSNDAVGLYDLVNDVFYSNNGTGVFVAGPEFSYNEIEYIESTGTQHINTGIAAKSTLKIQAKFNMSAVTGYVIIGHYTSEESTLRLFNASGKCYLDFGNGTTGRITGGTMAAGIEYEIEFGNHYVKNIKTGTNIVSGNTVPSFEHSANIHIFGNTNFSAGKIYYCKIYEKDVLVRDFIPCITSSGAVGFYDLANNIFYSNEGTGEFVAGPIIPDKPEVRPPAAPEKISAPYADFANVLLVWSTSESAKEYNVMRNGVVIGRTKNTFFFDSQLAKESEYSYSIIALNEGGESEPVYILAETTPFKLITDRTADDVQAVLTAISTGVLPNDWLAGMKGAYNATDFNRVEAAVLFVLKRLEVAGWYLSVQTKTDWTFVDFPNQAEMQRYLDNIRLLRAALPANIPAVPDTMRFFNYDKANKIEQILEMLDAAVTNIMLNVYYTNEIYSGEV